MKDVDLKVIVIGTKCDKSSWQTFNKISQFCFENDLRFYPTSAKTLFGVKELFWHEFCPFKFEVQRPIEMKTRRLTQMQFCGAEEDLMLLKTGF